MNRQRKQVPHVVSWGLLFLIAVVFLVQGRGCCSLRQREHQTNFDRGNNDQSVVAFSATTASGLQLRVFDNDSFVLGPVVTNNATAQTQTQIAWLQSGAVGFHSSGSWFLTQTKQTDECSAASLLPNTDCHGDDITYFNATNASACCAACQTNADCHAWTLTGDTREQRNISSDHNHSNNLYEPPWAHRCYLKKDCNGRVSYKGHTSGVVSSTPSVPVQPLVRVGAGSAVHGTDPHFGSFEGWSISYSGGGVPFVCTFKWFPSVDAIVFEHSFPQGVSALNTTSAAALNNTRENTATGRDTDADAATSSSTEFSSSTAPCTAFPSWIPPPQGAPDLGYLTWTGRFFVSEGSPTGASAGSGFNGAEGGPVVLFDSASAARSKNKAAFPSFSPVASGGSVSGANVGSLVLSPLDNPHGTIMGAAPLAGGAVGINSYATSAPPGFTVSSIATWSSAGVTDAMHSWGTKLRTRATMTTAASSPTPPTAKIGDMSSTLLSYWTDNGAYYDWYAYEPDITSKGVPQDVLVELADTFRNEYSPPLPVASFMLDAYWMYNVRSNGNCKVNDTFNPVAFPRAANLSTELGGAALVLYNGPQCAATTYAGSWPLVYSARWDEGWGKGVLSSVAGRNASERFFAQLFARLAAQQNMTVFTQDFLDFYSLLFPQWLENPAGGKAEWQAGQAAAALAANVPVQYCMALPADILASAAYPAVTNARASQDYHAGSDSSWRIGGPSLLLSALGVRASKDNFWSGSAATDRGREPSPFLSGVVTALSGGPVGFADELRRTDPMVLWPTMRLDGVLLHASRPATSLDRQFYGTNIGGSGSDVRAAHSEVPGDNVDTDTDVNTVSRWYSVLAAQVEPPATVAAQLTADDLWPRPQAGGSDYVVWQWNNTACVVDGGPVSECAASLNASAGEVAQLRPATPSSDATQWSLWSVAPVLAAPTQLALLGEVSKFVAVSPDRFTRVAALATGTALSVSVRGAPLENVTVAFVCQDQVHVRTLTLWSNGSWTGVLSTTA